MASIFGTLRNLAYPQKLTFAFEYAGVANGASNAVFDAIIAQCPSLVGTNQPHMSRRLPTGHLQTVYSAAADFSTIDQVQYKRKVFLTPDGGTIAVDIAPPALAEPVQASEDVPTVVILHGLTGGSHESYVRNCVAHFVRPKDQGGCGFRCVVVNSRGCADTPVTSPQLYSAANISDLESALLLLTHMFPQSLMTGIGFSLGGAILTRYMGMRGKETPLLAGVVVGAPFQLKVASDCMESFWLNNVYSHVMGRNLLKLLSKHADALALSPALWDPLERAFGEKIRPGDEHKAELEPNSPTRGTLRFVDHYVVTHTGGFKAPYGEFPFADADAYYYGASSTNTLDGIARPFLALNADDDPIVPLHAMDEFRSQLQKNDSIVYAHSRHGGHLGWFTANNVRWINTPIAEYMTAIFSAFTAPDCKHEDTGIGSGGPRMSAWKRDGVASKPVEVELLPASALLPALPSRRKQVQKDTDDSLRAWLVTQVLNIPLMHPKDAPARLAMTEVPPLPKGDIHTLTLVRSACIPY
ncbi:hypothetical protein MVES1_003031 [Malassezia vespertilionis]|uniref:uncharacterized protein n=1 Tax=Malassezia vespertilionis TaxID=2020962 RepID=UPI0024B238B1|nr:uncharacterized protein MVES1_003031 [Malassezia vespertilionis]WFD07662.1 hypothetical protein MVES1_003031 [Malassezia vespertilionis]